MPYKEGGKWRAVVKHGGARYQAKFETRREALRWERDTRARLGNLPSPVMGLQEFCALYLDAARLRHTEKTYREKVAVVRGFCAWLGDDPPVTAVTARHVSEYLAEQAAVRSANAANKDRKNLLAMWNWGCRVLDLPANPVAKVARLPHARRPQYTPPEDDVLRVLAVTSGADRVFLETFICTGARRSELFHLTWDDVNFERREIRLWSRKSRDGSPKERFLPMNDRLWAALRWLWDRRPYPNDPHVFVDDHRGPNTGKPYTSRQHFMERLCVRAGVRRFGFHALRRYVASMLSDRYKVSTVSIQRVLGHEHLSTTDRYIQNIASDLREVMEKLGTPGGTPEKKKGSGDLP